MRVKFDYFWILVGVDRLGKHQKRDIPSAKEFFHTHFSGYLSSQDRSGQENLYTRDIQKQLVKWVRKASHSVYISQMSTLCLRCFVSNTIYNVCQDKVKKFGQKHQFSIEDILPLVLDELPRSGSDDLDFVSNANESLTMQILQTFNPDQGNLSTWTSLRVRSQKELKRFLLEQGLEEVSDWVLLNERKPSGLRRILGEFFHQTNREVETGSNLLKAYHQAYRDPIRESRRQRQGGKRQRYPQPTISQLNEIAHLLDKFAPHPPEEILEQLRSLASLIREYRRRLSRQKNGHRPPDPPWEKEVAPNDDLSESLQPYLQTSLETALEEVIENRVQYFDSNKPQIATAYLNALKWFHCQGLAMGEIAKELGWKSQSKVSRFLELANLRADVRRQTLLLLKERLMQLKAYPQTPTTLKALDQRLSDLLEPRLDQIIQDAVREASTSKNRNLNSQFSQTLCQVLKSRKEER